MTYVTAGIGGSIFLAICYGTWRNPRLWSALFWTFVATFMMSAAIVMAFPAPFADKTFAVTIFMPLVWVGLQFWLYWNPGRWTVTAVLFVVILISSVIVALSPPPV